MAAKILLKDGIVLQHNCEDEIEVLRNTDVLIEGAHIVNIGENLTISDEGSIIDCRNKIICPGFIDAHHHLWQTQLKGRFGDATFLNYMIDANLQSINFTPGDIFWGQLAGCFEAIDSGTTCVVDNAHMSAGVEHGSAALDATITSGIRAIFCYGVSPLRTTDWTEKSFEIDRSPLPGWLLPQMKDFAGRVSNGNHPNVQLGFFFDSYSLAPDVIVKTFEHVRKLGVKLITSHFRHWPISKGQAHIPELLDSCAMLKQDILLSHGNGTTASQAKLLNDAGVYIASTPDAEVFMASGSEPVAFRSDIPLTCLGADCHSAGPSSMLHQIQTALFSDREMQTSSAFKDDHYPKYFRATVAKAFNMATINAARAIRMEEQIGSIAVGKLADIIIIDSQTPTMACAAECDPLTAVVRHASVREIDTVIIGGQVCKRDGCNMEVKIPVIFDQSKTFGYHQNLKSGTNISWQDLANMLSVSRCKVQERIDRVNKDLARSFLDRVMGGLEHVLTSPEQ